MEFTNIVIYDTKVADYMVNEGLVLWMFLVFGPEQGKVLLKAGIPDAEFYLDGTFIAKTGRRGELAMESFPPGTFRFAVRKIGYAEYKGAFTVEEGRTKTVAIALKPLEPVKNKTRPLDTAATVRRTTKRPRSDSSSASSVSAAPKGITAEAILPTPLPSNSARNQFSAAMWRIFGIVLVLSAAALLILRHSSFRLRRTADEPPMEPSSDQVTDGTSPESPLSEAKPEFLEELKRREELINAGFVGPKARDFNRDVVSNKEKEIVIVLPKEAYRYEEEK